MRRTAPLILALLLLAAAAVRLGPWSGGPWPRATGAPWSPPAGAAGVLLVGLLFGLRHATEADHIAAVGAIVSERRGWRRALSAGTLWGLGHTASILAAGAFVVALHVAIPDRLARLFELLVAFMIVGLGGAALARALRDRPDAHVHLHAHGGRLHRHLHFHGPEDAHRPEGEGRVPRPDAAHGHAAHAAAAGLKPLLVGLMHGLAGSAALTLLVLAQIRSAALGLLYLGVFGAGSIAGMAAMSLALALPFAATSSWPAVNRTIRIAAGAASLAFGLFYAWSRLAGGAV